MNDNELLLFDRIEIIKQTNQKYDLENNAYISFSGGKDSTILHYLIDMALPNNKIPRVFINTGIEYLDIVKFVKSLAEKDDRFVILKPTQPIKKVLETYGYPFKSKDFAKKVDIYQRNGMTPGTQRYLALKRTLTCPKKIKYLFTEQNQLKISDKCCIYMKEEPIKEWSAKNNKYVSILGLVGDEWGRRNAFVGSNVCLSKVRKRVYFSPLRKVDTDFENWFISKYQIQLCKLYYAPYNFSRTGCKGCPFSINLRKELETMEQYMPNERKQSETIWKPVYEEYRRIGYRLRKKEKEYTLFDYLKENNNDSN